jgi:uncharacterized surface protein with fasciclin (FAS1) repeats
MKKITALLAAVLVLASTFSILATPVVNTKNEKDIIETAINNGQFTILTKAIEAAGLTEVLKKKSNITVFAPTDAAFAKLPAGTLEMLLKPENKEKLKAILLFHVVNTELTAKKVAKLNGRSVITLERGVLKIDTTNGVQINGASVVSADVKAENGLIHVIDTVLIPN